MIDAFCGVGIYIYKQGSQRRKVGPQGSGGTKVTYQKGKGLLTYTLKVAIEARWILESKAHAYHL